MTVDKSNQRVRSMFASIARRYDLMNHVLSMNVDRYWRRRTVRELDLESGVPILDVCTGTGDLAFALVKKVQGQANVLGADFCRPMLELAEKKKATHPFSDATTFVEADAQSLPFPSDAFQAVTVAFGLRNVADTDQGLAEMTRVCRPGGRVVVLEFSMPSVQPLKGLYAWYFRSVLPRVGRTLANDPSRAYEYLPESVSQFPSGEALAERMRAAGLVDVSVTPMTFGIASIYRGRKP